MVRRLLSLGVLVALSCEPSPQAEDNGFLLVCDDSDDCPTGSVCDGTQCVVGTCDPAIELSCALGLVDSERCCARDERCAADTLECTSRLAQSCGRFDDLCIECVDTDDCAQGEACAQALCHTVAGRAPCVTSSQCDVAAGEHCDRALSLCLPARPCARCGADPTFAYLCCGADDVCSTEDDTRGECRAPPPAECNPRTGESCPDELICSASGRCVQCDASTPCGPGLVCDEAGGSGACVSPRCDDDDDCSGNERCAPATRSCVIPECQSDLDCLNAGDVCDQGSFVCEPA